MHNSSKIEESSYGRFGVMEYALEMLSVIITYSISESSLLDIGGTVSVIF